ncbi:MAG: L-histidine N(alpha)-methyltransferase [Gammaproteobacteria bacterium]|nr:L-histidine N(alpha)-methyltransferase [Gammaproteobacteria bacterium]
MQLAEDVRMGLASSPKFLHSKYFYDERGSQLFDEITRLPEYYLTRTETEIIRTHAEQIVTDSDPVEFLELGSGTADKTRLLLDALSELPGQRRFVAFDISDETLRHSVDTLSRDYPALTVDGIVGDFLQDLPRLPQIDGTRAIAFLGSTIGNLNESERERFFRTIRETLTSTDSFLMGVDLVKDETEMVAAYNDAAGITAQFNQNILRVVNRLLDANFPVDKFRHVARWDIHHSRIESWLINDETLSVHVGALNQSFDFTAGEGIHTEISVKFTRDMLESEFDAAGLKLGGWYTDAAQRYALARIQVR